MATNNSFVLSRTHRFAIGDRVHHPDDASWVKAAIVTQITIHIVYADGLAVPTYTIECADGEVIEDVLCCRDVISEREWRKVVA